MKGRDLACRSGRGHLSLRGIRRERTPDELAFDCAGKAIVQDLLELKRIGF
jgi:hypothetical protein